MLYHNLQPQQCPIPIVFGHTDFLRLMSAWFSDTQIPHIGAQVEKMKSSLQDFAYNISTLIH